MKNRGSVLISGLCFEPRESVLYLKCECFIKNSAATTSLDQRLRSQRRVVDGMVQDVCVIDICTADSKGRPLSKKIRSKFSVTILRNFRYLADNNSNLFRMKANYLCFSDTNYLFLSITIFDIRRPFTNLCSSVSGVETRTRILLLRHSNSSKGSGASVSKLRTSF